MHLSKDHEQKNQETIRGIIVVIDIILKKAHASTFKIKTTLLNSHKRNLLCTCAQAKLKISLSYEPPPSAQQDAQGDQGGEAEGDEEMEEEEEIGEPGKPGTKK